MSSKIRTRRRLMGAGLGTLMSSALLNIGCWGKTKKENNPWKCVYELNEFRQLVAGSEKELASAIGRGADLRIRTEFKNNEHIDT